MMNDCDRALAHMRADLDINLYDILERPLENELFVSCLVRLRDSLFDLQDDLTEQGRENWEERADER